MSLIYNGRLQIECAVSDDELVMSEKPLFIQPIDYGQHQPRVPKFSFLKGAIVVLLPIAIIALGVYSIGLMISAPRSVRFHFINNTPNRIDSFVFTHPHGSDELGPIAPGATANCKVATKFGFGYDYSLTTQGGANTGKVADWLDDDAQGYTRDWDATIELKTDGSLQITAFGRH